MLTFFALLYIILTIAKNFAQLFCLKFQKSSKIYLNCTILFLDFAICLQIKISEELTFYLKEIRK